MKTDIIGSTAVVTFRVGGDSVAGIAPALNLSVDTSNDLEIDGNDDLEVFAGIHWIGTAATKITTFCGVAVEVIGGFG